MSDNNDFERNFELLPEYIRGDLPADQRRELEAALERSAPLRQALEREHLIASEVRASAARDLKEIEMNSDDRFDELSKRVDAEDAEQSADKPPEAMSLSGAAPTAGSSGSLSFLNPRNWRPAVAMSIVAMGMSGVAAAQAFEIDRLENENYQLLSGCENKSSAAVIVEFSESATWPQITKLLAEEKLSIVKSGAFGVVELGTLGDTAMGEAQLERLRVSSLVSTVDAAK